jgi:hypothetical protein
MWCYTFYACIKDRCILIMKIAISKNSQVITCLKQFSNMTSFTEVFTDDLSPESSSPCVKNYLLINIIIYRVLVFRDHVPTIESGSVPLARYIGARFYCRQMFLCV